MPRKTMYWIGGSLLLLGALWFGVSALRPKKPKFSFREVKVERGALEISILSNGSVQPENRLEIRPPVAGRVEKVLVVEGQYVRKGQVLAYLSSSERAALLDAARAQGAEEASHWEELYKPTPLLAPLSGQVINRAAEPGQTVGVSDPILVLSDRLIVSVQVDETDIGRIKVGQETSIILDAYGDKPFPGKVGHVQYEARTVNNVTIYDVHVRPVQVPPYMRSGMSANVTFQIAKKGDALLVPSEALQQEDGKFTVRVPGVKRGGRPDRVEVETGLTDGKVTEVVSGLEEGATILIPVFSAKGGGQGGTTGANPFMGGGGRRGGGTRR